MFRLMQDAMNQALADPAVKRRGEEQGCGMVANGANTIRSDG